MKKLLLALTLCALVVVTGCQKKDGAAVPKSVSIYQKLELTAEQNKKLADIRASQRQKMEAIRKDMETKRATLLDVDGTKNFSEAQKRENHEKYRAAANEMREKLAAEREAYDEAFKGILDDKQKKTYDKYLTQREKERLQREKEFQKQTKSAN